MDIMLYWPKLKTGGILAGYGFSHKIEDHLIVIPFCLYLYISCVLCLSVCLYCFMYFFCVSLVMSVLLYLCIFLYLSTSFFIVLVLHLSLSFSIFLHLSFFPYLYLAYIIFLHPSLSFFIVLYPY